MKKIIYVLATSLLLSAPYISNAADSGLNPENASGGGLLSAGITSLGAGIPASAIPVVTLPLLFITIPVGIITTVLGGVLVHDGNNRSK